MPFESDAESRQVAVALDAAKALLGFEDSGDRRLSGDRLDDLRRVECVRLLIAAPRVIQHQPPPGMAEAALVDLADADSTLELLGPPQLARAAHLLVDSARKSWDTNGWDKYSDSRACFIEVARTVLRISEGESRLGIGSATASKS